MRYLTGFVIFIAAGVACSRGNDRPVANSPTSPTALVAGSTVGSEGGVSGPQVVSFSPRNESLVFRNNLETKYATGLGRAATGTYVDREGEVVWLQEYLWYRSNGCDQSTAIARVLAQIDGGAPGNFCTDVAAGTVVAFPARNEIFEMRRSLETKYQQMGRGLSLTAVDSEGASIWIAEYHRYRNSGCDHATAEQKVFTQIDGGAAPATCFIPCTLSITTSAASFGAGSGTGSIEVRPNRAGCNIEWNATSNVSWLTIASGTNPGNGFATFSYTVAQNNGAARSGRITVSWSGGSATYAVDQAGTPFVAGFTLVDPARSTSASTDCWIRTSSTSCNFTATANLPGNGAYTYNWTATYTAASGSTRTITQNNNSATFSFTDSCGGTNASSSGTIVDLTVSLTITDSLNNTITIRSGDGNQPSLFVRLYTCS